MTNLFLRTSRAERPGISHLSMEKIIPLSSQGDLGAHVGYRRIFRVHTPRGILPVSLTSYIPFLATISLSDRRPCHLLGYSVKT